MKTQEILLKIVGWAIAVVGLGFVCKLNYYLFMLGWEVL